MKATTLRPVTDKQIEALIKDAIEKNNWDKIFMFDHKGNADLDMARRVQGVISQMRTAGRIDPECTISAAMDISLYPGGGTLTGFYKVMKQFSDASQSPPVNGVADADAQPGGVKTKPAQAGIRAAAPV